MGKRIAAIGFIFFCTAIAWAILASTIFYRTYSSDTQLRGKVASSWGAPQEQCPPTATYVEGSWRQVPAVENGKEILRTIDDRRYIPLTLEKSRVHAGLHADYRRKGLLWYSTYQVQFAGAYEFVNPDDRPRNVTFTLHLPAEQAIYDDMVFTVNGAPLVLENQKSETYGSTTVLPHQMAVLNVGYRSQGLDTWHYSFGDEVSQVHDFELRLSYRFQGFRFSREYAFADAGEQNRPAGRSWFGATRTSYRDTKSASRFRKSCNLVRWRDESALLPQYRCCFSSLCCLFSPLFGASICIP